MTRILLTAASPVVPENIAADFLVLTPHHAAAKLVGVRKKSLASLARSVLKADGLEVASPLVARRLLRSVVRDHVRDAGASSFAARVQQILETILRTGVDTEALVRHGSPRIAQVANIAADYRARLRELELVDPVEVMWVAAAAKSVRRQKILVHGYYRASKEEIFFINAVAAGESVYVLPCHDEGSFAVNRKWADWLCENGWTSDPLRAEPVDSVGSRLASTFIGATPAGGTSPNVEAFEYPDIESEVRGVLASIKHLIGSGTKPDEIAVVCRDASVYGPVVADNAAEYELPVKISYPVPLAETSFGSFLSLLLAAVDSGFDFEPTARMLMHPFGPGLDADNWAAARKGHFASSEHWLAASVDIGCLEWADPRSATGWADCLHGALRTFEVRRRAGERARDLVAYYRFEEVLAEYAAGEADRVLTREEFIAEASELLHAINVPFSPAATGVALVQPNAVHGGKYRRMFVMGMAEGMLPASVVDNPVVDFHERKRLSRFNVEFEAASEVPRWESLSFYLLLHAAREAIAFSFPRTVGSDVKMENAYFDRLGLTPQRTGELSFISSIEEERRIYLGQPPEVSPDLTFNNALRQLRAEQGRESCDPFGEFDGVVGVPIDPYAHRWSVSQLTIIGQCSFRWFSGKLLRLKPLEEMEAGLSPSARGSFYHRVLEIAVGRAIGQPDVRSATLLNLEDAFGEAEGDPLMGVTGSPNWELQRFEHLRVLRACVESPEFITPGGAVLAVEQEYTGEWHGLSMIGYIDRVDETPGGILAIDYKTSSVLPKGVKNEAGKTKTDLQLPIYVKVALPSLYPGRAIAGGTYYSLTKGKSLGKVSSEYPAELDAFAEKVKHTLQTGNYAVDPDVDRHACEYCDFDIVCRQGHRLYRKGNGE